MNRQVLIGLSLLAGVTCLLFLPGSDPGAERGYPAHLSVDAVTETTIDREATGKSKEPRPEEISTELRHWHRLATEEPIATETFSLSETIVKNVVLTYDNTEGFPVRLVERRVTDPQTGETGPAHRHAMVGNRVILSVYASDDYEALSDFARERDYILSEMLAFSPVVLLEVPDADIHTVPTLLGELQAALPFLTAEPDYLLYPANVPNDPLIQQQWGLQAIDAFGAWETETGSPDIYVAVLDTGIDRYHIDLQPNIAHDLGRNFSTLNPAGDGNFDDLHHQSHGTRVSGIIGAAGNNAIGTAGVSWNGKIIPVRIGQTSFPTSNIIRGLDYITDLRVNQGVPVVATNNSYGATSLDNLEGLRAAVIRSAEAGIVFVAAAGNSGVNMDAGSRFYPASFDVANVVAVASTNSFDNLSGSSNYGSRIVHLGAPGEGIHTTSANNTYTTASGTSFAAPFVSGTLALLASVNPELTMPELKDILLGAVDPLPSLQGRTLTGGRLNAGRAVSAAERLVLQWHTPSAGFLNLSTADTALRLEVHGQRAGRSESLDPVFLDWETVSGPGTIEFTAQEDTAALAHFPVAGEYRLRAAYQDDERQRHSKPITILVGPAPERPIEGLAAHWNFDETSGTTLLDLSEQDRHGFLEAATRDTGLFGNALRFNGESSRATVSAPGMARMAFSAWVKSDSRGRSEITLPRILETGEHTLFWGRIPNQEPNNNTVKFVARQQDDALGVWYTEPMGIDDGEWFHITVSYDGSAASNDPVIYLDGRVAPVFRQAGTTGSRPDDTDGPAWLGNSPDFDRAWDGLIDDVRMYGRLLGSEEIPSLAYRAPAVLFDFEHPVRAEIPHTFTASLSSPSENPVEVTWAKRSGPGEVTFNDPQSETTTAEFSEPGAYALTLTADDGRVVTVTELPLDVPQEGLLVGVSAYTDTTLASPRFPVTLRFTANQILTADRAISFTLGGDAELGEHFRFSPDMANEILMPMGSDNVTLELIPLADASETASQRTFSLTVNPSPHWSPAPPGMVEIALLPHTFSNWRTFYFGSDPADGEHPEPSGNPSGDGFPKLMKYALGLNPREPAQSGDPAVPLATEVEVDDTRFPALSFIRPLGPIDVEYRVEVSEDLTPGSWSTDSTVIHATENLPNGSERVIVRDTVPHGESHRRFLRLKVLLSDEDY